MQDFAGPPEKLLVENQDAWDIFWMLYRQPNVGADGKVLGYNVQSLSALMDIYGIATEDRRETLLKVDTLWSTMMAKT